VPDALLFRLPADDAPPEWKVCADDWIDFYKDRGWFLLAREKTLAEEDARASEIETVRQEEEQKWNTPRLWRPRKRRNGTTGE
jgi:hypothetical protein